MRKAKETELREVAAKVFDHIVAEYKAKQAANLVMLDDELSKEFNVSRSMINAGLDLLEREQLIDPGRDHMIAVLTERGHDVVDKGGYLAARKKEEKSRRQPARPTWVQVLSLVVAVLSLLLAFVEMDLWKSITKWLYALF